MYRSAKKPVDLRPVYPRRYPCDIKGKRFPFLSSGLMLAVLTSWQPSRMQRFDLIPITRPDIQGDGKYLNNRLSQYSRKQQSRSKNYARLLSLILITNPRLRIVQIRPSRSRSYSIHVSRQLVHRGYIHPYKRCLFKYLKHFKPKENDFLLTNKNHVVLILILEY